MSLVDTGPLVAVLDADDRRHVECRTLLEEVAVPLIVPMTVVVEVCQIAERSRGPHAEAAFLRSVVAGELVLETVGSTDLARAGELVETYADFGLGLVDASVIAVAERLGIKSIATYRWSSVATSVAPNRSAIATTDASTTPSGRSL